MESNRIGACLSMMVAGLEHAERLLMAAEEKRTWEAYELNERNFARMVGDHDSCATIFKWVRSVPLSCDQPLI